MFAFLSAATLLALLAVSVPALIVELGKELELRAQWKRLERSKAASGRRHRQEANHT